MQFTKRLKRYNVIIPYGACICIICIHTHARTHTHTYAYPYAFTTRLVWRRSCTNTICRYISGVTDCQPSGSYSISSNKIILN